MHGCAVQNSEYAQTEGERGSAPSTRSCTISSSRAWLRALSDTLPFSRVIRFFTLIPSSLLRVSQKRALDCAYCSRLLRVPRNKKWREGGKKKEKQTCWLSRTCCSVLLRVSQAKVAPFIYLFFTFNLLLCAVSVALIPVFLLVWTCVCVCLLLQFPLALFSLFESVTVSCVPSKYERQF